MRAKVALITGCLVLLAALPAVGQTNAKAPYKVEFNPKTDVSTEGGGKGEQGLFFNIRFKLVRQDGAEAVASFKNYKVVVELDGREIERFDVPEAKISEELSTVLAVDISGSMGKIDAGQKSPRIDQARAAAKAFVKGLPAKADCGLILFDHEIKKEDKAQPSPDRKPLWAILDKMQERGGTAYLDAAKEGVEMLAALKTAAGRKKALVILTDGVDLHSKKATKESVIKLAKGHHVQIYTIGIGEPGTNKPVTSVLVLDHSQSMELPANQDEKRSKIDALHEAASAFVDLMPNTAMTTVLAFGSTVDTPGEFSKDKARLIATIKALQPKGETAMLDAAYDAVATLSAQHGDMQRAVVVMTDGIDNTSRHRPDDVIQRAKEKKITLHMLAFGKEDELRQARDDMERMAKETGGTFHHAKNAKDLIRIFEDMSNALHDDGIDVPTLTEIANQTGGKYYHARDISKLKLILEDISQALQEKQYELRVKVPSGHDGAAHGIAIKLLDTTTNTVVSQTETVQNVRGVVVAEMSPFVYLGLLAVLGLMLAVPMAMGNAVRSLTRS
jgi:Mg-chelatase subunit ChlD